MFSLALRSVRHRPGRFLATLLAAFLGATITMTFNSLHDTAAGAGVDDTSAETLGLTGGVVGGYGTLLVFFAIASTLTVNVRQRADEIHLLRCTGATPAQIKRMVVGEAAVVALVGTLLAMGPALLGGRALVAMFHDTGQVADSVHHVFGPIALLSGFWITLLASVGAAFLAVRRATRAQAGGRAPRGRLRTFGGVAALVGGLGCLSATFAIDATEPALMAAPAYGSILLSLGFAALSPALLRGLLGLFGRPLTVFGGASGYLAVHNMRRRAAQLAGILMPLIVFTGVATATLCMQAVENDALKASGLTKDVEAKNLETLNLVAVGIIVVFACVMLINSLYAATSYRTREFGGQRLAGATPGQVLGTVGAEGLVLTLTGLFFGTVAGLAGIVPFALVRTDGDTVLPDQLPVIWLGISAMAAVATLVTSLATTRRTLRIPAVMAVTAPV
ncbi:FtsX-like permease family protein [Streptomyces sp. NPDC058001]|uniref:ABC transporter permease n=1 Tax=Streptomyces sp. NPDC058001 TaxID=3346300 RepID=UPI0036E9256A